MILSPVGDFISTQYQNLNGYFNTFYNAKRAFNEGVESTLAPNPADKGKYPVLTLLDVLQEDKNSLNAKPKFDLVIEKCSKILNNYTKSSLVDNALLLMGKSYFYGQEYTRAERKFLELIKQFPESSLINEAKLWCGKTFLKNKRENDAFIIFSDVIKNCMSTGEDEIIAQANLILSSYSLSKYDTVNSIKYYTEILKYSDINELKAQTSFRLGEIYEKYDSILMASDYYFKSSNYTNSNMIRFWGLYKYAVLQKKLGKIDLAFKILNDLNDNKSYQEYQGHTYLGLAEIYYLKDDIDNAVFHYKLVDSLFSRTEAAANGYYQLGLIYENYYKDFFKARDCYQKSSGQLATATINPLASDKFKTLDAYLNAYKALSLLDSGLIRLHKPDTSYVRIYDTLRYEVYDTIWKKPETRKVDSLKPKVNTGSLNVAPADSHGISQKVNPDTVINVKKTLLDSSKQIKDSKNTYLSSPDRKIDSIITRKMKKAILVDSTLKLTIDTVALTRKMYEFEKKRFELGEIFLDKFNNPDSALYWFDLSYPNLPIDTVSGYYIFKIAEAKVKISDTSTADSLYRIILDKFPKSNFYSEVKVRLGIPITATIDTVANYYSYADSLLQMNKITEAKNILDTIIKKYPKSNYAAKSEYTLGWIDENISKDNKKAINQYRKLLENYPSSQYAQVVKPKIDTVEKYFPSKKKVPPRADSALTKKGLIKLDSSAVNLNANLGQSKNNEQLINLQNKEGQKKDSVALLPKQLEELKKRQKLKNRNEVE